MAQHADRTTPLDIVDMSSSKLVLRFQDVTDILWLIVTNSRWKWYLFMGARHFTYWWPWISLKWDVLEKWEKIWNGGNGCRWILTYIPIFMQFSLRSIARHALATTFFWAENVNWMNAGKHKINVKTCPWRLWCFRQRNRAQSTWFSLYLRKKLSCTYKFLHCLYEHSHFNSSFLFLSVPCIFLRIQASKRTWAAGILVSRGYDNPKDNIFEQLGHDLLLHSLGKWSLPAQEGVWIQANP